MFKASEEITVECWTWYSVCFCTVLLRLISRRVPRGDFVVKKQFLDDWIITFATCTYTIAITCLFVYAGISGGLDYNSLTPQQESYYGKKLGTIIILAETSMQTTLWSVKASLLVFYFHITDRIRWNTSILLVGIYIGLAYSAIIIALYGGWCRPFSQYLVLKPYAMECLTWHSYSILQMTLNVSSDILIIIIPFSVLAKTSLEWKRKLFIGCLFGLGIFVITAAILQKIVVFIYPTEPVWLLWSIREISTAMIVGNVIVCVPLMRKISRYLDHTVLSPLASLARTRSRSERTSDAETLTTDTESGLHRVEGSKTRGFSISSQNQSNG